MHVCGIKKAEGYLVNRVLLDLYLLFIDPLIDSFIHSFMASFSLEAIGFLVSWVYVQRYPVGSE